MREDAPAPKHPPKKRYQLERALDLWLATWAHDEELPERERARVQDERDRRKALKPQRELGLLVEQEGVTPQQLELIVEKFRALQPTGIHHPWVQPRVHSACIELGVPVKVHRDVRDSFAPMREVVLSSDIIVAAPRGMNRPSDPTPVWDSLLYARHRKLPLTLVLPNGTEGEV